MEETIRGIVREEIRAALSELREALGAPASATTDAALLTVEQVAVRAGGVKPETVRRWIDSKRLAARRAGHRWVVRPADLEQFLAHDAGGRETIAPEQHLQLVAERLAKAGGRKR